MHLSQIINVALNILTSDFFALIKRHFSQNLQLIDRRWFEIALFEILIEQILKRWIISSYLLQLCRRITSKAMSIQDTILFLITKLLGDAF